MKAQIEQLLLAGLTKLQQQDLLPADLPLAIQVERTKNREHGDFASNVAMLAAKVAGRKPRELAEQIVAALPASELLQQVTVAGPGFINFHLTAAAFHAVIPEILQLGDAYGRSQVGAGQKVLIEFVSANPTGPLHVGHGRGAAYGAALAEIMTAAGFVVSREYYVNDGGRQMAILTVSVWLRYLAECGESLPFPVNAYQGDYIITMAKQLHQQQGQRYQQAAAAILADLPPDELSPGIGDKEVYIDALIARAQQLLGEAHYQALADFSLQAVLRDIQDDLAEFGVHFEQWFSERSLLQSHAVTRALERLKAAGYLYEQDGATWFRSTALGDDKDRVLIRANGQPTYFMPDIAYHLHKYERGFDKVIDVLGADHHGYVARMRAAIQAMAIDPASFIVILVQFAILYRGQERIPMSTRSGSFVTLRELRAEVGNDAARFFYVMRKSEQHMDFDLELAKSHSNDNPVYYIQYAHARICSVWRQMAEKQWHWDQTMGLGALDRLIEPQELALLTALARYPEVIASAALQYEPHLLTHYLRELANDFHVYYNAQQFLVAEAKLCNARLCLIAATRQVLANGLKLLGVNAPEAM